MTCEMRAVKASLAMGVALLCSGCALPQLSVGADPARSLPGAVYGGGWRAYPGYARDYGDGVVCDRFGRCWRAESGDRFARLISEKGERDVIRLGPRP